MGKRFPLKSLSLSRFFIQLTKRTFEIWCLRVMRASSLYETLRNERLQAKSELEFILRMPPRSLDGLLQYFGALNGIDLSNT